MSTHRAERTTILQARPEVVWHALMSPDIAPVIDPSVKTWQPDTDPPGVGTRFTIRGRLGGVPFRAVSEAVVWELHRRAVFHNVKPSGPLRMIATHLLEPMESSTRYTWSIDVSAPPPISRIIAWLSRRTMEAQAPALAAYVADPERSSP